MGLKNFMNRFIKRQQDVPSALSQGYTWSDLDTISIGPVNALTVPVVYATIKMLSEDIARLPIHVYQRDGNTRTLLPNHPLVSLLNYESMANLPAYDMRRAVMANLIGWGNAYLYVRRAAGRIIDLTPIPQDQVTVMFNNTNRISGYMISTGQVIPPVQMIHMRGVTLDGIKGISAVQYLNRTLKNARIAEEYAYRFSLNYARAGAILEYKDSNPPAIDNKELERIQERWNAAHSGAINAGRTAVLPPQWQYKELTIPREDAQLIQTRTLEKRAWAMCLRVPLHLIGDLEKATFSNIEQQSIEYVKYCLVPYLRTWESALTVTLLSPEERVQGIYLKHNVDELLRGESKARMEAYSIQIQAGVRSINEVRALEELSPIEGGDDHLVSANLVPLGYHQKQQEEKMYNTIYESLEDSDTLRSVLEQYVYKTSGDYQYSRTDMKALTRYMGTTARSIDCNKRTKAAETHRCIQRIKTWIKSRIGD